MAWRYANSKRVFAVALFKIKSKIKAINHTSLERLLGDTDVRTALGLTISKGVISSTYTEQKVVSLLTPVIDTIAHEDFSVRKIDNKNDRKTLIDKLIPEQKRPTIKDKAPEKWSFPSNSKPTPSPKPKPRPVKRTSIIPKDFKLKISVKYPKVNKMYHEMQKINVNTYTQLASLSLRVFLELSIDAFIQENTLSVRSTKGGSGFATLHAKLEAVKKEVVRKNLDTNTAFKGIISSSSNQSGIDKITTLHQYIHNPNYSASANDVITTWTTSPWAASQHNH